MIKRKLRFIRQVSLALALVLSMGLVMAGPIATPTAAAPPVASGLVLHLDADAMTGLNHGDPVATWADQSTAGNDATQGTLANQPLWMDEQLNGKPVVRFDGSDYLAENSGSYTTPLTIFAVGLNAAGAGDSNQHSRLIQLSATSDAHGFFGSRSNDFATFFGNGSAWHDIDANTPGESVLTARLLAVVNDGTTAAPYVDGVAQNPKTGTMAAATGLIIGSGMNGAQARSQYWGGDIAEILIYDRALSDSERERMEWYLGEKWLGWERPAEVWVCITGDDDNDGTETEPFATIQKGVDIVAANGTVHVCPGTYTENVTITRSLTLRSTEGAGVTTITGLVTIDLDDGQTVVFGGEEDHGFTIDRGNPIPDSGILLSVDNGSDVTISHSIITGGDVGIRSEFALTIAGGSTVVIEDNKIIGNDGHGIYMGWIRDDSTVDILGNTIGGQDDDGNGGAGIYIGYIDDSAVTIGGDTEDDGNTISHNGKGVPVTGIHIDYITNSDVIIEYNTITDNGGPGIYIDMIGRAVMTVTIARNTITDNTGSGIHVRDVFDSTLFIEENTIRHNGGLQDANVWINSIYDSEVTIEANTINDGRDGRGIRLDQIGLAPETVSIIRNTIIGTDLGVSVGDIFESALNILGNVIEDNKIGVGIGVVANSTPRINFNNIVDNEDWGVRYYGNPTAVDATHNWWGDASGPKHEDNPYFDTTEGDEVSDNVDFTPWLGAAITLQPTGCTTDRDYGVGAEAETDNVSAEATDAGDSTTTVTVAEYVGNPSGVDPGFIINDVFFFDVHVGGTLPDTLVVAVNCPGGDCSGVVLRWFDGTVWRDVTPVSYTNGTIVATLGGASSPTIAQLTGTAFGAGNPAGPVVGGTAHPATKLLILLPWVGLAAVAAGTSLLVLRRRRAQSY